MKIHSSREMTPYNLSEEGIMKSFCKMLITKQHHMIVLLSGFQLNDQKLVKTRISSTNGKVRATL